MNKAERVLCLFWQLYNGLKINKDSFCFERGIDKRTFERDIEDIRNFLSEMYAGQEIIYDRKSNTYYMAGVIKRMLTEVEYTALVTILLGSRALRQDEMKGLICSLERVSEHSGSPIVADEVKIEKKDQEQFPVKPLLKMQWDLYQCIQRRLVIRIQYLEEGDKQGKEIEVIPQTLYFTDKHFMLEAIEVQGKIKREYCIDQIESFETLRTVNIQENRLYLEKNE